MQLRRALFLGGLSAGVLIVAACSDSEPDPLEDLERSTGTSWAVQRDPVLGTPSFLMPRKEGSVIRQAGESPPAAAARFLERYKAVIGIRNVGKELVPEASDEGADAVGLYHASFRQNVDGIPVFGLRYSVHFDGAGHVAFASGRYRKDLEGFGTKPAVPEAEAIAKAVATLGAAKSEMQTATLVIEPTMPNARLVWNVDLGVEDGGSRRVTIDAMNGAILSSASLLRRATATGKGVRHYATSSLKLSVDRSFEVELVGKTYRMSRPAGGGAGIRVLTASLVANDTIGATGGGVGTDVTSASLTGPWDAASGTNSGQAVDAMFYTSLAEEWYRGQLKFSFADAFAKYCDAHKECASRTKKLPSGTLIAKTHAKTYKLGDGTTESFVDNAFFDPYYIFWGYGDASNAAKTLPNAGAYDTYGHEMQHAVNNFTLGLEACPTDQSCTWSALDESIADIFSSFQEHYFTAVAKNDVLAQEGVDPSKLGESLQVPPRLADRDYAHPEKHGGITHMEQYDEKGDNHGNGSITTNAFWIMTHGTKNVFSGRGIPGRPIGWANAQKIYWSVLKGKDISGTSSFSDLARALTATARKSLPDGDRSDGPAASVACAFVATGILTEDEILQNWDLTCTGKDITGGTVDGGATAPYDYDAGGPMANDGSAVPLPDTTDCLTEDTAACDVKFPGKNYVCSWNGDRNCCRKAFVVPAGTDCYSDDDCTKPGEVCARATDLWDASAAFGCIKPADRPCATN